MPRPSSAASSTRSRRTFRHRNLRTFPPAGQDGGQVRGHSLAGRHARRSQQLPHANRLSAATICETSAAARASAAWWRSCSAPPAAALRLTSPTTKAPVGYLGPVYKAYRPQGGDLRLVGGMTEERLDRARTCSRRSTSIRRDIDASGTDGRPSIPSRSGPSAWSLAAMWPMRSI